jgi:5-hydroxyisourate hydrolase
MAGITTHVLDTAKGRPAAGMRVRLVRATGPGGTNDGQTLFEGVTDADGRARVLAPEETQPGTYRITFDTGSYERDGFFPEATIAFRIVDASQHYHVPLLFSPFGYSTYRGS